MWMYSVKTFHANSNNKFKEIFNEIVCINIECRNKKNLELAEGKPIDHI